MLRNALVGGCLVFFLVSPSGCLGFDLDVPSVEPELLGLEDRYVVGSAATALVHGSRPITIESSDPNIVRVERGDNDTQYHLDFLAPGRVSINVTNRVGTVSRSIDVAPHTEWRVFLVANVWLPAPSRDLVLVTGQHCFTVVYSDVEGQLHGRDLARVEFPSTVQGASNSHSTDDTFCMTTVDPGPHVVEVAVREDSRAFTFATVPPEDLVTVELIGPDEEELPPGSLARVDPVGFTEDGTQVTGFLEVLRVVDDDTLYLGYFTYDYDPGASPQELYISDVFDIGFDPRRTFHGTARYVPLLELEFRIE